MNSDHYIAYKVPKCTLLIAGIVALIIVSVGLGADTGSCNGSILTLPLTDLAVSNNFSCAIAGAFFSSLTNGRSALIHLRDRKGAIGALMDEYERAALDLKGLIEQTSEDDFARIIDLETKDEDCRSIQTIITHVVRAGYGYANHIRQWFSIASTPPPGGLPPQNEAVSQIDGMLAYTAETLRERWEMNDEEIESVIIESCWGVKYNLEQLLEHAIVHILRHRRQIERLSQKQRDEFTSRSYGAR
jgi:uncharacterized damage-inducible protein DinB